MLSRQGDQSSQPSQDVPYTAFALQGPRVLPKIPAKTTSSMITGKIHYLSIAGRDSGIRWMALRRTGGAVTTPFIRFTAWGEGHVLGGREFFPRLPAHGSGAA